MLACCPACAQAAVVLAHMDLTDPLVFVILSEIRSIKGNAFPVIFITGHTHTRGMNIHKVSCICRDSFARTDHAIHTLMDTHAHRIHTAGCTRRVVGRRPLPRHNRICLADQWLCVPASVHNKRLPTVAPPQARICTHTHTHTILIHYSCGLTE